MKQLRSLTHKEVPSHWTARLAGFSPPSERVSFLKLRWEPGYPWETPVDRWVIDQLIPEGGIREDVLEQLRDFGPPSSMGNYYDSVLEKFIVNPDCLITEKAWHIYRETRCWAKPFWVIQGSTGGHKRFFTNVEKQFLQLAGLPSEAPFPGDLPYADFDDRVMAQLRKHDELHKRQRTFQTKRDLMGGVVDERTAQEERRFRVELMRWLDEQMLEVGGEVTSSLIGMDAPRGDFDVKEMERQSEQAVQNYIETGKSHNGADLSRAIIT